MNLEGKVAIVSGGAQGIGKAISLLLAKHGVKVVVNYNRSEKAANELVEEIKTLGGDALAVQADVSNFEQAKHLVDSAVSHFGTLNILVNNAGITDDALFLRMTEEQFDRVINTNLKGVFNLIKHASKTLLRAEQARVINISSISALTGNAGQVNYTAAKAGVIGMSKTLAREFASRNVTVNVIAPGLIETNMTKDLPQEILDKFMQTIPLKRFGKPEEIANTVLFLASDLANYITGQVIQVDGGLVI